MDQINQKYLEKFEELEHEFDECEELLASVEIMTDNKLFQHYRIKQKKLGSIVLLFKKYKELCDEQLIAVELAESATIAEEKTDLQKKAQELEVLKEKVFEDAKQAYMESGSKTNQKVKIEISIKQGDNLFVDDIKQMFQKYADCQNFEYQDILKSETSSTIQIEGQNVFEDLKCFSGTIRKIFESKESTALVVVLESAEEEIEIDEKDIVIEISKSSGAGGQHINKTESAVKLIHLPTGISAECQDERSQGKNKEKAMIALKEKISQKISENNKKYIKNQRNMLKNAIFSDTPILIFDFDKNKVIDNRTKKNYDLKDIYFGDLKIISRDMSI